MKCDGVKVKERFCPECGGGEGYISIRLHCECSVQEAIALEDAMYDAIRATKPARMFSVSVEPHET